LNRRELRRDDEQQRPSTRIFAKRVLMMRTMIRVE
jgi:hypothetical protein